VWAGGRLNVQNEKRVTATKGAHFDVTFGEDKAVNFKVGVAYDDVTALDHGHRQQRPLADLHLRRRRRHPAVPAPDAHPGCDGRAGSAVPQASLASLHQGRPDRLRDPGQGQVQGRPPSSTPSTPPLRFSSSAATGASSGFIEEDHRRLHRDER
jgi:hypothetical protein